MLADSMERHLPLLYNKDINEGWKMMSILEVKNVKKIYTTRFG